MLQTHVGALEPAGPYRRAVATAVRGDGAAADVRPRALPEAPSLLGATGVALSDLRPGGFARIRDARVDVITRGEYIPAGEPIEVVADEGYRRVVRRREPHDADQVDAGTSRNS